MEDWDAKVISSVFLTFSTVPVIFTVPIKLKIFELEKPVQHLASYAAICHVDARYVTAKLRVNDILYFLQLLKDLTFVASSKFDILWNELHIPPRSVHLSGLLRNI